MTNHVEHEFADDTRQGQQGIFDLIRADHRLVEELFAEIEGSRGEEKTALIERCIEELLLHTVAEEETLYARLRDNGELHDDVLEGEVEHGLFERLAQELMSSSPEDELCDARLMVLRDLVARHVEREEEELLPIAEDLFDADTALLLAEEMRGRKRSLAAEGFENAFTDEFAMLEEIVELEAEPLPER